MKEQGSEAAAAHRFDEGLHAERLGRLAFDFPDAFFLVAGAVGKQGPLRRCVEDVAGAEATLSAPRTRTAAERRLGHS